MNLNCIDHNNDCIGQVWPKRLLKIRDFTKLFIYFKALINVLYNETYFAVFNTCITG